MEGNKLKKLSRCFVSNVVWTCLWNDADALERNHHFPIHVETLYPIAPANAPYQKAGGKTVHVSDNQAPRVLVVVLSDNKDRVDVDKNDMMVLSTFSSFALIKIKKWTSKIEKKDLNGGLVRSNWGNTKVFYFVKSMQENKSKTKHTTRATFPPSSSPLPSPLPPLSPNSNKNQQPPSIRNYWKEHIDTIPTWVLVYYRNKSKITETDRYILETTCDNSSSSSNRNPHHRDETNT